MIWREDPEVALPARWLVCFHERAANRWVERVPGRFKHVSAIGWFPAVRQWVLHDFGLGGTSVVIWPDGRLSGMGAWIDDAVVVSVPARAHGPARLRFRHLFGFWCVPAVRHLTGVEGRAFLPDGFLKDCEAVGTRIAEHDESAESTG